MTPDPTRPAAEILAVELAFFEQQRAQLLKDHRGKFALIRGSELIGTFDTDETAYVEGVKRFGRTPFLIRRIEDEDPTAQFPALTYGLLRAHS
jgi:hypothetical protein